MNERARFVLTYEDGLYSVAELCQRFCISRKTGYKWISRYHEGGLEALNDVSRAPHSCPHRTAISIEERIVAVRKRHPRWGPRKLLHYLCRREPDITWPAESTVGQILKRHGLSQPRRRRRRAPHPTAPALKVDRPNQVWTADFKGEFRLLNGAYCYPLTIADASSRYLLACQGLASTRGAGAKPVFKRLFANYGLPQAIRTDNGVPFACHGMLGLTLLSVWWLKLGISHQRIAPGQPQQNGRHERMHLTLKQETTLPREADMKAQQERFARFIDEFNNVRPHQSLDGDTPASHYQPSSRSMPPRIKKPAYPAHFEVRKVSDKGTFKFRGRHNFISTALAGEYIGLEEVDYAIWSVFFYHSMLARFDEQNYRLT